MTAREFMEKLPKLEVNSLHDRYVLAIKYHLNKQAAIQMVSDCLMAVAFTMPSSNPLKARLIRLGTEALRIADELGVSHG